MEYFGKLYGKVDNSYFPLIETTDDFELLQRNIKILKYKLQVAEKALNDIEKWDDNLENEWSDPGERAGHCLKRLALLNENNKAASNHFSIRKGTFFGIVLFDIVDNEQNKVVCNLLFDNREKSCDEIANRMLAGLNGFGIIDRQ